MLLNDAGLWERDDAAVEEWRLLFPDMLFALLLLSLLLDGFNGRRRDAYCDVDAFSVLKLTCFCTGGALEGGLLAWCVVVVVGGGGGVVVVVDSCLRDEVSKQCDGRLCWVLRWVCDVRGLCAWVCCDK